MEAIGLDTQTEINKIDSRIGKLDMEIDFLQKEKRGLQNKEGRDKLLQLKGQKMAKIDKINEEIERRIKDLNLTRQGLMEECSEIDRQLGEQ